MRAQRDTTYRSWMQMKQRCTNPRTASFHRYGGRGIHFQSSWASFEQFLADMGPRPDGAQLDRIDNDADYSPTNCRWVSAKQNARNRSDNRLLTHAGVTRPLSEWAEITGLGSALQGRIRIGWSADRAITTPLVPKRHWTPEEEATLREKYSSLGTTACRALMPYRTIHSIHRKAVSMGLKNRGRGQP